MTEGSKQGPVLSPSLGDAYSGAQCPPPAVRSGAGGLLAANVGIGVAQKVTGLKAGQVLCPAAQHLLIPGWRRKGFPSTLGVLGSSAWGPAPAARAVRSACVTSPHALSELLEFGVGCPAPAA